MQKSSITNSWLGSKHASDKLYYIYIYIYIGLGIAFYTGCFFSANQELSDKINAIQLIKFKVTEIIY